MGRKKVELRKIENKAYRHISFSKRKSGLLKKAYELSTLCDTEVALILFSPAGKLFLYEGKKRLEDILQQYMDLPEGQRGRLNNQKLIQAIIAQLNFEWSIYKKERLGLQDVESPLGGFHNELDFCDYELKEIEKHLTFVNERYFLRSANVIKTVSEAENHEGILEEALARLRMQKQILEANQCFQKSLENATVGGFDMVGSSTYNFNPPTQFEPNFPPIDMPSASYEFQPFSNKPQHFAGNLQMPPTGLQGFAMDYGQTSGPDFGAYNVPQPQLGQLVNTNLPSTTDFTKDQASTSFNAVQSNFRDSTLCSLGACSHSECGHPFMF